MKNIEETTALIRDSIQDLPTKYKQNERSIQKLDLETQDLLHLIELKNLNAVEGFKVYKDLQRVRKERRILKDENELLGQIVGVLQSVKDKVHLFDDGLTRIRKVKMSQENRHYSFRVRHDLDKVLNGRVKA